MSQSLINLPWTLHPRRDPYFNLHSDGTAVDPEGQHFAYPPPPPAGQENLHYQGGYYGPCPSQRVQSQQLAAPRTRKREQTASEEESVPATKRARKSTSTEAIKSPSAGELQAGPSQSNATLAGPYYPAPASDELFAITAARPEFKSHVDVANFHSFAPDRFAIPAQIISPYQVLASDRITSAAPAVDPTQAFPQNQTMPRLVDGRISAKETYNIETMAGPTTTASQAQLNANSSLQSPAPATNLWPGPPRTALQKGQSSAVRPPEDTQLPQGMEISVTEINTFFPNHIKIPALAMRFARNGVTQTMCATQQLRAIDEKTHSAHKQTVNRLKYQYRQGSQLFYGEVTTAKDAKAKDGIEPDLTPDSWKQRAEYRKKSPSSRKKTVIPKHAKLSQIYGPVQNWPQGQDRLALTQCLEWAKAHPELPNLDTSHLGWIQEQIEVESSELDKAYVVRGLTRDHEAIRRFLGKPAPAEGEIVEDEYEDEDNDEDE